MTGPHEASGVLDAGQRLRRLLSVLAYLAEVGEATITELCERFALDRHTLVSELELAACCGLPPYTPDQLLELVVDDERVMAFGLEALSTPPRLTADEGFAVAATARALLAVGGGGEDSSLQRALEKLEAVLGDAPMRVELDEPTHFDVLRRAAADGELVEIDYLGAQRGDETTRLVMAYAVVAREGHFYLDGFCHLANDWRRFQLDRIVAVRPTGRSDEPRTPPGELSGSRAFAGGANTQLARISIPKEHNYLVEQFAQGPMREIEDNRVVVTVEVADPAFLGRLLLRIGREAVVLEPKELVDAPRAVATRALARYETSA